MIGRVLKRVLPPLPLLLLRNAYYRGRKTVSQLGQDFWVFGEVFNEMEHGYFLEVGSADGLQFNNTFLLEKRYHWSGICIEPNPLLFKDLRKVRRARCLNVCLDAGEGEVDFFPANLDGGIVGDDTDNKRDDGGKRASGVLKVRTQALSTVLKAENAPRTIDYLSIDVEGAEERILSEFPFETYTFNCMTVERPKPRLREVLARQGYVVVKEVPHHDVFYVHESFYPEYERNIFRFWAKQAR